MKQEPNSMIKTKKSQLQIKKKTAPGKSPASALSTFNTSIICMYRIHQTKRPICIAYTGCPKNILIEQNYNQNRVL